MASGPTTTRAPAATPGSIGATISRSSPRSCSAECIIDWDRRMELIMKKVLALCITVLFGGLFTTSMAMAAAPNWPAWRGPEGTGVSPEKDLPVKWDAKQNVRWRVDLPG